MANRSLVPIAAFLAALAVLVGVRLWSDDDPTAADGTSGPSTTVSPASGRTGGLRFVDVTRAAGLDAAHSSSGLTGESAMTAGAAVADIDGDGDLDIYLTRVGRPNRLLVNDGRGHFDDVADRAGVAGDSGSDGSGAAAFADVDGDDDADLVVTGAGRQGVVLYLNDGDGGFADSTSGSGLDLLPPMSDGETSQMHGVTFADYDRDGRLDLLLTHWDDTIPAALADPAADTIAADERGSSVCARAAWLRERGFPRPDTGQANRGRLFRNVGDGRFDDVTAAVGLPFDEILGFTGTFADIDDDGWDDLLVTGDFCTSRLFRNVDGTRFEDITASAGVGTDENGMGSVVRDLNGDGRPDWFITGIGPVGDAPPAVQLAGGFGSSGNRAYLNDGDGTFTDATDRLGLRNGGWGWGAAIEDFANDGHLSVAMTNGYDTGSGDGADSGPESPADDPLRFWVRDGDGFLEGSAAVGLDDAGLGRAMVPFDMDRDGDLDLLVANFGGPPKLFRNDSPTRHWITVRLDDPTSPGNREGVGSKLVIRPGGGAEPVTAWVATGGSYESQVPAEVHVGLDTAEVVDRLEVTWPGGSTPQVLDDVPADRVVVVHREPTG